METYNQFDVVKVPFPFIDSSSSKKRPALVLSPLKHFNAKSGASILAMITSIKSSPTLIWPMDIVIQDLEETGLPFPSLIRMKLFTLDNRLILGKLGTLSNQDQQVVSSQLKQLFLTSPTKRVPTE